MRTIEKNIVTFSNELLDILQEAYDVSIEIWGDCTFDEVKFMVGNYSGYGSYWARYRAEHQVIEIPLNESHKLLKLKNGIIYPINKVALLGTVIHEYGHHVQRHHKIKPWDDLKGKDSTHSTGSWCWICSTGWKYYFPESKVTPELLAWGVRQGKITKELSHFAPNSNPEILINKVIKLKKAQNKLCNMCGKLFMAKKSNTLFCSSNCRVKNHREKKLINIALKTF